MTRKLVLAALLAAATVAILAAGTLVPTATLGMAALAGICVCVCVLAAGKRYAALCWAVSGALALILLPDKGISLSFALFFGPYPLVKAWAERRKPVWEWLCKLAAFNGGVVLCAFLMWKLTLLPALPVSWPVLALLGNLVFVIYDFGLSRLLFFVERRLSRFFG